MGRYLPKTLNVYIVSTVSGLEQTYSNIFVQSSEKKNGKIQGDLHSFITHSNTSSGVLHRPSTASYNLYELEFIGTTISEGYREKWDEVLQCLPDLCPGSQLITRATSLIDVERSQPRKSYSAKVLIQLVSEEILMISPQMANWLELLKQ
ncbi:hypothetical protein N7463_000016 [Penicillium fimorum]|uniref:Uncharacterized protein n=1 Tax=Penicillium fimorum TaxID=1882269 RepID=A0A9W9Y521_9EURO|nr:hypothetical protein N7463_000016 [Penicillium fimorum]